MPWKRASKVGTQGTHSVKQREEVDCKEPLRRLSTNSNRKDSTRGGGDGRGRWGSQLDPGIPGGVWGCEQPYLFDMQKEADSDLDVDGKA